MSSRLTIDGQAYDFELRGTAGRWQLTLDGKEVEIELAGSGPGWMLLHIGEISYRFHFVRSGAGWHFTDGRTYRRAGIAEAQQELAEQQGQLHSTMPGKVLRVLAEPGQRIEAGQPLIVLEAMKMEHTLAAPASGLVQALPRGVGDRVMPGDLLAELELDA